MATSMTTCGGCGAQVRDSHDNCPSCGTALHLSPFARASAEAEQAARDQAAAARARDEIKAKDRTDFLRGLADPGDSSLPDV